MSTTRELLDVERRARAIAAAAPFDAWPDVALGRLANAARVVTYRRGEVIQAQGSRLDSVVVPVSGTIQSSAQNQAGRRYTFVIYHGAAAYGLLPLVDGQELPNDTIAATAVVALVIPFAAIHAELAREPALWQSLAYEVSLRARRNARQWTQLALEPLRARAAAVLVALAESSNPPADSGPVTLSVPLPQERFGEMLGVSRQTATALVGDLVDAGLVRWRYGRVSVLDLGALREAARAGGNSRP